jgi:hypothetical protein
MVVVAAVLVAPAHVQATALPATISTNTTLAAAESPYSGTSVTVLEGVTLTVKAGVVVKLSESLTVNGRIEVEGSASEPVVFTSPRDDSAGGDTNGDGTSTKPAPGDWLGLAFKGNSQGFLHAADVRYAGMSNVPAIKYACPCVEAPSFVASSVTRSKNLGIEASQANLTVDESTIADNGGVGIRALGGTLDLQDSTIARNNTGVVQQANANEHVSLAIDDNVIEANTNNGIDVEVSGSTRYVDSASLGENLFKSNGGIPLSYVVSANLEESPGASQSPIPPNIATNTLTGNGKNGIWVSGSVMESQTWDAPYAFVVFGEGLNVAKAATLTLTPGTVVKNEGRTITVGGTLVADGTAEEPIALTSYRDDSAAGDTNGDGTATKAAPGDWWMLEIRNGSGGALFDHAAIRYGGRPGFQTTPMIEVNCPCAGPSSLPIRRSQKAVTRQ